MQFRNACLIVLLLAGCASTPPSPGGGSAGSGARSIPAPPEDGARAERPSGPAGTVNVDIADLSGRQLPSRIELQDASGAPAGLFEVPEGRGTINPVAGTYTAYVHVYDKGVPVLVAVQDLAVQPDVPADLAVDLLEGASGKLGVRDFDLDGDLAIDRVELEVGTNHLDASSIPGKRPVERETRVLEEAEEPQWYKGELHAISEYGGGEESVAELVRRAEQAGLDFLAITDLNTMEATRDPGFQSDKVVLIPALAWGTREKGIGLIYAPGTEPGAPESEAMAQAECVRVQNQGGVFVVAHPCFPDAPWKWGVRYMNAVQVWNGPWRAPAPLRLSALPETLKKRDGGDLVYSIAAAAAVADKTPRLAPIAQRDDLAVSANDQAALFWDYELVRGQVCSVVAGSMVDSRKVPMGQPVTWVRAENKSLPAIMDGLRKGRTFVGNRPDGVQVNLRADVLNDGTVDVGMGGAIPLNVDVGFYILVTGAAGAKAQLLRNGHPIMTEIIEDDIYSINFLQTTDFSAVYRLRVIRTPEDPAKGYGPVEVLALSSPIYADDIGSELLRTGPVDLNKTWVSLDSKYVDDDRRVPR